MKCIVNGKLVLENQIVDNKVLVFTDKIIDIVDEVPNDCEVIDAKGRYVCPGLIDIHIHGNMGKDTMEAEEETIVTIANSIKRHGVTSFLPTTMTMGETDIDKALDNITEMMKKETGGSQVIGAHLEGPFINSQYKGAQNGKFIVGPSYNFINKYKDIIKVITYAPESDTNFEFTKQIKCNTDIVLSIGHTNATYKVAKEAINLGARNITHMFNGMNGLKHREPGVIGAAFTSDVYCEIIADKIHIVGELFQFILDSKGEDKVILVTDSIEAGGLDDGEYSLGGQKVIVKDNQARLENGSLAGSVTPLNVMVSNFMDCTDLDIRKAIKLASINPARSIKIDDRKGSIEIGKDADIAIFDENLNCYTTISNGKIIYQKKDGGTCKMRVIVCENYSEMSKKAAQMLAGQISLKPDSVLGLATGSTPEGMYEELVKMYNNNVVDFSEVKTFNLDEYYQLPKENDQSYDYFMRKHLFNYVNIKEENIKLPNGMAANIEEECKNYDKSIEATGGIDIQILGIGHNAHIGFNEPSSEFESGTHLVDLKESTIKANSIYFESADIMPKQAVTMGTGTIFKSKKIILMASGEGKAEAIYNTIHGNVSPEIPSSILQFHDDVVLIVDKDAASKL